MPSSARSLWTDQVAPITPREPLPGDRTADVAIVGAGYSGLWTAHYLLALDPSLRVVLLERDFAGFGASGRNGGWAVGELAGRHVPADQMRAMFDAVDEIGRVCQHEGIECDYHRGGTIRLARTAPQFVRQCAEVSEYQRLGFGEDVIRLLDEDDAAAVLAGTRVHGGIFFAPSAAVHPMRLTRGLASAVERRGAQIFEGTPVTGVAPGRLSTPAGTVRAEVVVVATEAYTRDLPRHRRALVPLYSQMIATEPLAAAVWASIGLADRQTFCDDRHLVIYGQRTADDRIAFGARGNPAYLFGSRISRDAETRAHEQIAATLRDLLPQIGPAEITHRWGGVLGVPRDWRPGVAYDARARLGRLGGYVGEGVAAANLAGRTLAELITSTESPRTRLEWVGHRSRKWEPEPLRWAAINAGFAAMALADRREASTGRESRLAGAVYRLMRR